MGEFFEQKSYKMGEFWPEEQAFPPQAYTYDEQQHQHSLPASMTSSFSSDYSGDAGSSPDHFSVLEGMMCKGEQYGYFPNTSSTVQTPTISFETTQNFCYYSSDENYQSSSAGSVKVVRVEPIQAARPQPVYEVSQPQPPTTYCKQQTSTMIDNWVEELVSSESNSPVPSASPPPPPLKRAKVTFNSTNCSDSCSSASSPVSVTTSKVTDQRRERRKETNRKARRNYRKKQDARKVDKEARKNEALELKKQLERDNYAIKQNLSLMLKLFASAATKL